MTDDRCPSYVFWRHQPAAGRYRLPMEYAARIAPEIDRLVLAVNIHAGAATQEKVSELSVQLGLDTPALLKHYAEFLLAGRLDDRLAVRRLPYQDPKAVLDRIRRWRELGLVEGPPTASRATEALEPLLRAMLDARTVVARDLWGVNDYFDAAQDLVEAVVRGTPERFVLAVAHRQLPAPPDGCLRLHHRLTTLRYARLQSHVEAWTSADLDRDEAVAITKLWHRAGVPAGPTLDRLVARGLADHGGGLTVAGLRLRQAIEEDTNRRTRDVFASLDDDARENLIISLAMLPGEPS